MPAYSAVMPLPPLPKDYEPPSCFNCVHHDFDQYLGQGTCALHGTQFRRILCDTYKANREDKNE